MKICIFTLALHTNYGGILQAYALQTILREMGNEVTVLNKIINDSKPSLIVLFKRLFLKLLGRDVVVFKELKFKKESPILNKEVRLFRTKYINERFVNNLAEINNKDFDCFIVGSDQIWRPRYFKDQWAEKMENAYLSFTKGWNVKRISYAASFGVDVWEYSDKETDEIRKAIKLFDAISVREVSGTRLLKDKLDINSVTVLDPTFLLRKEDYIRLFETAKIPKSDGNLLVYMLEPSINHKKIVSCISDDMGMTSFSVNREDISPKAPIEKRILPSLESWLRGFYDAEFVITDSFHACVFSIIFGKPFFVFSNSNRGKSRLDSLLSLFGLESCLIDEDMKVDTIYDSMKTIKSLVNSPFVKERLEEQKSRSLSFLTNSII